MRCSPLSSPSSPLIFSLSEGLVSALLLLSPVLHHIFLFRLEHFVIYYLCLLSMITHPSLPPSLSPLFMPLSVLFPEPIISVFAVCL